MSKTTVIIIKPVFEVEAHRLHLSQGNTKVGRHVWNVSSLPGNAQYLAWSKPSVERAERLREQGVYFNENGEVLLTSIPGTCSHNCGECHNFCYAFNALRRYPTSCIPAWGENTLFLREDPDGFFAEIDARITELNKNYNRNLFGDKRNDKKQKVKIFRWNVSGEIQNVNELLMMDKIARKHPEVLFGIYSKNYDVLAEFFDLVKENVANNFVINVSEWHGIALKFLGKYGHLVQVFEYDDSNLKNNNLSDIEKARLKSLPHCPAVTINGKRGTHLKDGKIVPWTCEDCKHCYTKTNVTHICVWSH